ncbi:glycosyltransferase family 2 protein [uncultured Lacinutrix sp.]|uniref:glycosyltransferase family 2 protein n=1 Tax=uncultured Lacinutrix sp. TaxID=574032 RepID=UPI002624EAD6|nr:glycosyltransferase family A protein [uncultured Lacinutrix sp.]
MLILVHNGFKVTSVLDKTLKPIQTVTLGKNITTTIQDVVNSDFDGLLVWCYNALLPYLKIDSFTNIFHHKRILASFNPTDSYYFQEQLAYVERSYFFKIKKEVTFPTWLMSSYVGGIHSQVLKTLNTTLNYKVSFDYFLASLAKKNMTEGLFCYSDPRLLTKHSIKDIQGLQASKQELFKFVKQHYKWLWVFFMAWCYAIYEKKISIFSLIKSLFYRQLIPEINLETIAIQSTKIQVKEGNIDVIIPTIGRKKYLYDVLKDLAKQTQLPKSVIIVEQNPKPNSVSELDYLTTETWPFSIKHEFTNQAGVCNARNMALAKVESEWTFLADDDIRFDADFFETSLNVIKKNGISVLNYLCLQPHQKQTYYKMHQTTIFGSGSSLVKSNAIKNLQFNTAYEFGFGEDSEFGMQLRYKGEDVIFIPNLKITHLKAPFGGYRTKIKQLWQDEVMQPKPSPTIQLLHQTYFTKRQLEGYQLLLFLKQFKAYGYKNALKFKKQFAGQWNQSVFWSNKLKENNNA